MARGILQGNVYAKTESEKDKLRIGGGSWSINLDTLPKGTQHIKYDTEEATYELSMQDALIKGFTRVLGGENKLIVPLKYWIRKGKRERGYKTF